MSVADRWHTKKPRKAGGMPVAKCRQHDMYPGAEHGKGDRWQVRWYDLNGEQRSANRPKKNGQDPATSAEAYDAKIASELNAGTYVDPGAGAVTLETYGRQWESGRTSDHTTRELVAGRLKRHVWPRIGHHRMDVLARRPSMIQQWIKAMETDGLGASTIATIVGLVSSIFIAAMDDGLVSRNPCRAKSVQLPKPPEKKIVPLTRATAARVATALPKRYQAMVDLGVGCGHRQGEIFGLAEEDVRFLERRVQVVRQIRQVRGKLVFAPPKGGKTRDVPLGEQPGLALSAHMADVPPVEVTLPWLHPEGELVTVRLVFTAPGGKPIRRQDFGEIWRCARRAAGIPDTPEHGMHILRHTFASACLALGVDIRTLADDLGHSDPAFTLRVYAHLMPDAGDRTRRAVDAWFTEEVNAPASALHVPSPGR